MILAFEFRTFFFKYFILDGNFIQPLEFTEQDIVFMADRVQGLHIPVFVHLFQ